MATHPHPPHVHHRAGGAGSRRYLLAILLNLLIIAVEIRVGQAIGSAALLADAVHNASDVIGLGLAAGAAFLMTRAGPRRFTYGYGKAGILAAIGNGLLLVFVCGALALEAISRLRSGAVAPPGLVVMAVAALAVVINLVSAAALGGGHAHDVNRHGARLHLLADAGISLAVVVAGLLSWQTGAGWIDPVITLLVVLFILGAAWRLLARSLALALDAAPAHVDAAAVRAWLGALPGVTGVHDLHIWPISATEAALTVHLTAPGGGSDALLRIVSDGLRARFGLAHVTIQVETSEPGACDPCDRTPDDRATGGPEVRRARA
ncbi:cation diffusion facilitator family transporter [Thermaurantiacus sp.]